MRLHQKLLQIIKACGIICNILAWVEDKRRNSAIYIHTSMTKHLIINSLCGLLRFNTTVCGFSQDHKFI